MTLNRRMKKTNCAICRGEIRSGIRKKYCSAQCSHIARYTAHKKWSQKNPEKSRESCRNSQARLRMKVLEKLGGPCCRRCGFNDIRALQVDHIKGNGRQEILKMGSYQYYKKILKGASEYQVLCANCNWIKRVENKEYKAPAISC